MLDLGSSVLRAHVFSMISYMLRLLGTVWDRKFPCSSTSTDLSFSDVTVSRRVAGSNGSARDEEPLVINAVNGLGSQVLVSGYFKGARINAVWGVRDSAIGPMQC